MDSEKLAQIDYSPLSLPANQLRPGPDVKWRKMATVLGGLFLTLLGPMLYQAYEGDWLRIFAGLIGVAFFFLVVAGVIWIIQRLFPSLVSKKRMDQARLRLFSKVNGFESLTDTRLPQSGMQFRDDGITECGFRTKTVEIGNYAYHVPRQGWQGFGYVRLRLPREVSQIVFDAKVNNKFGWTNLNEVFDETSRVAIDLEFDALYTVYASKGYEAAARSLAQQFRDVLIKDGVAAFDMECVAYDVYLYHSEPLEFSEANIRYLLQLAEKSEVIGDGVMIAGNEKVAVASSSTWFLVLMGFFAAFTVLPAMAPFLEGSVVGRIIGMILFGGLLLAFLVWAIWLLRTPRK